MRSSPTEAEKIARNSFPAYRRDGRKTVATWTSNTLVGCSPQVVGASCIGGIFLDVDTKSYNGLGICWDDQLFYQISIPVTIVYLHRLDPNNLSVTKGCRTWTNMEFEGGSQPNRAENFSFTPEARYTE